MLKVIIADDEPYICSLLQNLINWEEIGFYIVGIANNGRIALEMIKSQKPDVVITDIRMPGLDGLDLVKEVQQIDLNVSFILISGHKEFEYAYSAIKYGVEYYMLKPINKEELLNNLYLIKSKLFQKQDIETSLTKMAEIARKGLLIKIASSSADLKELNLQALSANYMFDKNFSCCSLALMKPDYKIDLENSQKKVIKEQIETLIYKYLNNSSLDLETLINDDGILIFMNHSDTIDVQALCNELQSHTYKKYYEYCSITISIDINVTPLNQISYDKIKNTLIHRISVGTNQVINSFLVSPESKTLLNKDSLSIYKQAIEISDKPTMESWFANHRILFLDKTISPISQFNQALQLTQILEVSLEELYHGSETNSFDMVLTQKALFDATTRLSLFTKMKEIVLSEMEKYIAYNSGKDTHYVRIAKQYISEHYHESISLEDIASLLYVNPSYFSGLFKKDEGINFIDYLTNYRIGMAKELLKDRKLNIAEVGNMIGYKNAKYFSKIFYKVVGITPSDYKKLFI